MEAAQAHVPFLRPTHPRPYVRLLGVTRVT